MFILYRFLETVESLCPLSLPLLKVFILYPYVGTQSRFGFPHLYRPGSLLLIDLGACVNFFYKKREGNHGETEKFNKEGDGYRKEERTRALESEKCGREEEREQER